MIEMNKRVSVQLMTFILLASTVMFAGSGNLFLGTSAGYTPPGSSWSGYVTILPNGSLSDSSAPISHMGNVYAFTGNINGTLTVNRDGAVINGNGFSIWNTQGIPPVKLSNANYITVENLTVSAWYSTGISIVSSSHDTIVNNTVNGMVTGIFVYSPYGTVENNVVNIVLTEANYSGYSTGIVVKASSTEVINNTITMIQPGSGISVQAGMSDIRENVITFSGQNSHGIDVNGASNIVLKNYIVGSGNDAVGVDLLLTSQSNLIEYNNATITGTRGIGISTNDGFNTIAYNNVTVSGSYSYGLATLSSGTGSNALHNNLVNVSGSFSIGIYDTSQGTHAFNNMIIVNGSYSRGITSQNAPVITGNEILVTGDYTYGVSTPTGLVEGNDINTSGSYTYGIYSWAGQSAHFTNNSILAFGPHAFGILLNGQFQTVSGNTIEAGYDNGTGIMTNSLVYSEIANNSILYTNTGILFTTYTSHDLVFDGNYLLNDTVAFNVVGVASNIYYHNSFVNYTTYMISGNGHSIWDNGYPSGGNYWYVYTGVDLYSGVYQNISGSDGIGDTQFNVTSSNIDHYPLMGPWTIPTVKFVESGLSAGQTWSVTFNGELKTSNTSVIIFGIPDGAYASYNFSIGSVQKYTNTLIKGAVNYAGSNLEIMVSFTAVPEKSYNVTFLEFGLPSGTEWSVTLDGITLTSTGSAINFDPPNGTYTYTIQGVAGYSPGKLSGTVNVTGQALDLSITFEQIKYVVQFVGLGLPSGTVWYVNLSNGESFSSSGPNILFYLPNGTYSYSVNNVSDFNSTPSTGSFTVSGNPSHAIGISFGKNTTLVQGPAGLGNLWAFIIGVIIGGALMTIIVAGIYYYRRR